MVKKQLLIWISLTGCGNNENSGNDLKVPNSGNMNNLNSTNNNTEQNVTKFTIGKLNLKKKWFMYI